MNAGRFRSPTLRALLAITPLLLLALTIGAWNVTSTYAKDQSAAALQRLISENEAGLTGRIDAYEQAMRGLVAVASARTPASLEQWQTYVRTLNLMSQLPGARGVGYVIPVDAAAVETFARQQRENGQPRFDVKRHEPDGPYYITTYVEPDSLNQGAAGLNLAFESRRRQAAEHARDTGRATVTNTLTLVNSSQAVAGLLWLNPVYDPTLPLETQAQRRSAHRGWITASFTGKSLLRGLTSSQGVLVNMTVYGSPVANRQTLLYADDAPSRTSAFTVRKTLNILQQQWIVEWRSTPAFEASQHSDWPLIVLVSGLATTLALATFVTLLLVRRPANEAAAGPAIAIVIPLIVFGVSIAAAFALFRALDVREVRFLQRIVAERASQVRLLIDAETQSKLYSLRRMARRWNAANGTPEEQWRRDAANHVIQLDGLKAVEWIDSTYHIRWIEPASGNEQAVGLNVIGSPEREAAFRAAALQDAGRFTPPLDLVQGYRGVIAYSPIQRDGKFDGFLAAVFSLNDFFTGILSPELLNDFRVRVRADGAELFLHDLPPSSMEPAYANTTVFPLASKEWEMELTPSTQFTTRYRTWLPHAVLVAGFAIAILLSLTVRAVLIARSRAHHLAELYKLREAAEQERLRNEARLRITEERYRLLIDGLADYAICWLDPSGRVTIWNVGARNLMQYDDIEIVGKAVDCFFLDEDRAQGTPARELQLAAERGRFSGEGWRIRRDGSRFWASVRIEPVRAVDGSIMGFAEILHDESVRREAIEALRMSEETFRGALQAASIGMALVKTNGHWLKVNPAVCELLGYTEAELLSNDFQSITHPDDLERDMQFVVQMLAGEISSYRLEKRYFHRSGRIVWALLSVSLARDSRGEPLYFVSQIQDITEQKEIERLKNEFISVVSHELRTPLTSIRGSLGLILGSMASTVPQNVKALLDIAHNNCERLIPLINDILDIDKMASGKMRFDVQEHSLARIAGVAIDEMRAYAQKLNVNLALGPMDGDLVLAVDETRFIQVLSNLLSNAAKFSPAGSLVFVGALPLGNRVKISVQDNGPGIPESFRARIFEKFSQADSSSTRRAGGTGLGLHITRQIVERMHGRIGFDTEVGQGTTFWVEFPLVSSGSQSFSESMTLPVPPEPSILHVEDDVDLSNVIATALGDHAEIVLARDLRQAEEFLSQRRFSLLLLDMNLPDGSAVKLLDRLQSEDAPSIPTVILSAEAPSHDIERRVDAVMVKTRVSEARVVQTILEVLKRPGKAA